MKKAYILVALLIAGCSPRTDQSMAGRQRAIDITAHFMLTGDTTGLRGAFGDSVLAAYSPSDMINARSDLIYGLGEFQKVTDLHFHSDTESHVTFGFERGAMTFTLLHDESGKIVLISEDTESVAGESSDSTGQTAMTDLVSTDALRMSFNADSQYVRLVSLLSPT